MSTSSQPSTLTLRAPTPWRGCLRVAVYFALLGAPLLYWGVQRVRADAERVLAGLGAQLLTHLGDSVLGPAQEVELNGQKLFVASRQSELSIHEVLDRFDATCSGRLDPTQPFAPPEVLAAEPPVSSAPKAKQRGLSELLRNPMRLGILRHEEEGEGQLACLVPPAGRNGLSDFVDGAKAVLDSGDLSRFGDVLYVVARKLPIGKTHVLAIWSDGQLRLGALLPGDHDAPGTDLPFVPRPPNAVRTFSASATGRSYGLRLYESPLAPRAIVSFYEREMKARGWAPLDTLLEGGMLDERVHVRAYTQEGRATAVAVEAPPDGKTSVTLIDMGAVRKASSVAQSPLLD